MRYSKILNLENIQNLTFYQSENVKKFPDKILFKIWKVTAILGIDFIPSEKVFQKKKINKYK